MSQTTNFKFDRCEPKSTDAQAIRSIVQSSGFFHDHEVEIAVELVEERLSQGLASGYHFRFVDAPQGPVAYACFGEIPCTKGSIDLYWIAVDAATRGQGIGHRLLRLVEADAARLGGRSLWAETSGRPLYAPTQAFYVNCGFELSARLPDFYDRGDDKLIFGKVLETGS